MRQFKKANAKVITVNDRRRNRLASYRKLRCGNNWFDEPTELAPPVQSVLPDYVIHLHAAITTACDQAALEETLQTNLLPSIALMMACMEMKLKRVILMGSGEEFGLVTGRFDDHSNVLQYAIACHVKMERSSGKDFPKTFFNQVD